MRAKARGLTRQQHILGMSGQVTSIQGVKPLVFGTHSKASGPQVYDRKQWVNGKGTKK